MYFGSCLNFFFHFFYYQFFFGLLFRYSPHQPSHPHQADPPRFLWASRALPFIAAYTEAHFTELVSPAPSRPACHGVCALNGPTYSPISYLSHRPADIPLRTARRAGPLIWHVYSTEPLSLRRATLFDHCVSNDYRLLPFHLHPRVCALHTAVRCTDSAGTATRPGLCDRADVEPNRGIPGEPARLGSRLRCRARCLRGSTGIRTKTSGTCS